MTYEELATKMAGGDNAELSPGPNDLQRALVFATLAVAAQLADVADKLERLER